MPSNKEKIAGKKGKGTIRSAFDAEATLRKQLREQEIREVDSLPPGERAKRVREILKSRKKQ